MHVMRDGLANEGGDESVYMRETAWHLNYGQSLAINFSFSLVTPRTCQVMIMAMRGQRSYWRRDCVHGSVVFVFKVVRFEFHLIAYLSDLNAVIQDI